MAFVDRYWDRHHGWVYIPEKKLYKENSCTLPYRGWVIAATAAAWTVGVYNYGLLMGFYFSFLFNIPFGW